MIVQCDQCNAKFKLDDVKVKESGVKVRCSKCKHIFEVRKETPQEEPDFDSILSGLDTAPSGGKAREPSAAEVPELPKGGERTESFFVEPGLSQGSKGDATEETLKHPEAQNLQDEEPESAGLGRISDSFEVGADGLAAGFGTESETERRPMADDFAVTEKLPENAGDFDFGDFNFSDEPNEESAGFSPEKAPPEDLLAESEKIPEAKDEVDFGDFSFSEEPTEVKADSATADGQPADELIPDAEKPAEEKSESDFGDFNFTEEPPVEQSALSPGVGVPTDFDASVKLDEFPFPPVSEGEQNIPSPSFDEFSTTPSPVQAPEKIASGVAAEEFSFGDDFPTEQPREDAFSFGEQELSSPEGKAGWPPTQEPDSQSSASATGKDVESDGAFDFGSFDFSEASSATPPLPEVAGASFESEGEKTATSAESNVKLSTPSSSLPVADEDLPPLTVATRRQGSHSVLFVVLAVVILLILGIAGGGYFFYKEGPTALNSLGLGFAAKWVGLEGAEEGRIVVRNLIPAFIVNQEGGELFAITGEAVNNFKKPRASIQVKAVIYGPKGEIVLQKNAYAGNALTKEQLTAMPLTKIEAAMNNQFGDSLANLGVPPGKSIPFTIIFTSVPKEVKEFGVEAVGSTVAGQ